MNLSLSRRYAVFALPFLTTLSAYGQQFNHRPDDDAAAAAGAAGCFACGGIMIVVPIAIILLQIFFLVWVYKDAKSRGMENSVMWLLIVWFIPIIGLIVYLFSRPAGDKVTCPSCGNKRLQGLAKCPHCGNP